MFLDLEFIKLYFKIVWRKQQTKEIKLFVVISYYALSCLFIFLETIESTPISLVLTIHELFKTMNFQKTLEDAKDTQIRYYKMVVFGKNRQETGRHMPDVDSISLSIVAHLNLFQSQR